MQGRQGAGAARRPRTIARRGRCAVARALSRALALAVLAVVAGCGQKGPLVRRDAQPGAAVTLRGPAGTAAPVIPAGPPAAATAEAAGATPGATVAPAAGHAPDTAPAADGASTSDAAAAKPRRDEPDAPRTP